MVFRRERRKSLIMAAQSTNVPVEDPLEKLLKASKDGSVSEVENLLKNCDEKEVAKYVNSRNSTGLFPLFVASSFGHDKVVECLIQKEAKVDLVGPFGMTALSVASEAGHTNVVQTLNQAMANVNHVVQNRLTPLMLASRNGHADTVEVLLDSDQKADVNLSTHDGLTALMLASKYGHANVVKLLLPHVSSVDTRTIHRKLTALMLACAYGHSEVAEVLLDPPEEFPGANVDLRCSNGYTSLLLASHFGHHKVAKVLLKHHADVDMRTSSGKSALIEATEGNHVGVVEELLKSKAQVDLHLHSTHGNGNLQTALMIACEKRNVKIAKLLLKAKSNVKIQDCNGHSALHFACKNGDKDVVEKLVELGADVNMCSYYDHKTALLLAIENGHTEIAEFLLEKDANPNTVKADSQSTIPPLLAATALEHVDIVELLLDPKYKCDPNVRYERSENFSLTPLMLATIAGHHKLVRTLVEKQAIVNTFQTSKSEFTCIDLAIACGDQKIFQLLKSVEKDEFVESPPPKKPKLDIEMLNLHEISQKRRRELSEMLQEVKEAVAQLNISHTCIFTLFESERVTNLFPQDNYESRSVFLKVQNYFQTTTQGNQVYHPPKKPTLKESLCLLQKVAHRWRDIGIMLGINDDDNAIIQKDYGPSTDCLREMLKKWLNSDSFPTWEHFAKAIEDANVDPSLVAKIRETYI